MTGTYTGGFMGLPPSGKTLRVTVVVACRFQDGLIVRERRIYDFIAAQGEYGATCDEICVELGMLVQTVSGRCNDLARAGLIARDGVRRRTRTGASAYVWTVKSGWPER